TTASRTTTSPRRPGTCGTSRSAASWCSTTTSGSSASSRSATWPSKPATSDWPAAPSKACPSLRGPGAEASARPPAASRPGPASPPARRGRRRPMASAKFGEDTGKRTGPKPGDGASSVGGNRDVEGTPGDVLPRRPGEANERKAGNKAGTEEEG